MTLIDPRTDNLTPNAALVIWIIGTVLSVAAAWLLSI